ncbi:unnamed protein product [Triticum turgidum subsp. durum]|uniref:Uncharacterized protein n=1 Tax=Triticum turgidum subsp. durum TaxID=4567 RepID=A0A9R1NMC6_TRITD|nr:unnamed protein product [Triticum turgidum subsp. durum]
MSKRPGGTKKRLKRGLWSPEEDEKLMNHIAKYGNGCWSSVPKIAGLERCGKSCRLRWINYLRPDLKRGAFSQEEEDLIIHLHSILGNKWSQIAAQLPGRTDNEPGESYLELHSQYELDSDVGQDFAANIWRKWGVPINYKEGRSKF